MVDGVSVDDERLTRPAVGTAPSACLAASAGALVGSGRDRGGSRRGTRCALDEVGVGGLVVSSTTGVILLKHFAVNFPVPLQGKRESTVWARPP